MSNRSSTPSEVVMTTPRSDPSTDVTAALLRSSPPAESRAAARALINWDGSAYGPTWAVTVRSGEQKDRTAPSRATTEGVG